MVASCTSAVAVIFVVLVLPAGNSAAAVRRTKTEAVLAVQVRSAEKGRKKQMRLYYNN